MLITSTLNLRCEEVLLHFSKEVIEMLHGHLEMPHSGFLEMAQNGSVIS